jgi:hypothetical protein
MSIQECVILGNPEKFNCENNNFFHTKPFTKIPLSSDSNLVTQSL